MTPSKSEKETFSCAGDCGGTCGSFDCSAMKKRKETFMAHGYSEAAVDAVLFKELPTIYGKGLSEKEKESAKRASKKSLKAPRDSDESLKQWPSDKAINKRRKESGKKAPESPSTKAYRDKFGDSEDMAEKSNATAALKKKAKDSGIPLGILRQVYGKGVAAWKTGHRPGTTPQQWGMARTNSFITGSGGARKADPVLWKRASEAKRRKRK